MVDSEDHSQKSKINIDRWSIKMKRNAQKPKFKKQKSVKWTKLVKKRNLRNFFESDSD